ncbi:MAG: DUF4350 domain-containing protein, partial [Firmicutes bacterium]|nr:DUF4350 domain-containing protein [Bacillota bacterium]
LFANTRQRMFLFYIPGALIIWLFYIGLWTYLAENSLALGLNLLEPLTGALDYRPLLFLLLLVPLLILLRQTDIKPIKLKTLAAPVLLTGFCLLFGAVSSVGLQAPVKTGLKQVVFWDTGIDFSVPDDSRYGLENVGMFGILPHYLAQNGYHCIITKELSPQLLAETSVLVIFNPSDTPTAKQLSAIETFVQKGGSVLAVGDHTGDRQIRLPLETILKPVHISLRFDSAMPFKNLWPDEFTLRPSQIFKGVLAKQTQVVVGASLETGSNAKPLLIGRGGWSDAGDINNLANGNLGDLQFNRGERIGDLILAAEADYGQGKYMVFGDTTSFQNTVLAYSYPLIDNIFAYLSAKGPAVAAKENKDNPAPFFAGTCVIDMSHLELIGRDKSDDSVDGLIACLLRARIMPYVNQLDHLEQVLTQQKTPGLLVLIEPAALLTAKEQQAARSFMEQGGRVIVCAGYDSPQAGADFLSAYGMAFDQLPIGRIAPDRDPAMAFWNACPILYDHHDRQVQVLMAVWGYPTIAYKQIGVGGLYVIADPGFLKNKNLESLHTYSKGNVRFVAQILRESGVNK